MRILPIIICILCSLISKESYAACSDATGKATINEVYKLTTGGGTASFVEIKIIDETLTSAVYDEWTLQICYEPSNNNLDCKSYNVSDFNDNFPWLYIQAPTFEDNYLDFKKGFDITLRGDATDNGGADSQEVIDYVVTKNFFEQDLDGCSTDDLPYWFGSQNTNNGTKLAKRISDGTGGWEIVNSNDESETPGANNDGEPVAVPSCDVLFPGNSPLGGFGSIGTIDIKGSAKCNGGSCSVENVTEERLPTIPNGGSDLGEFNRGSLSDTDYNFYNNWKSSRTSVTYSESSGTAVIYIESNGNDIIIPESTNLNTTNTPEPAEVLLVIKTDKKVEIGKNSTFNAFVYIVADEIKINEDTTINGAFTVVTNKLIVEERVELNYNISDLNNFDPHGFCEPVSTPLIDHYQIIHDGNGLTCDAETVTIKACSNTYDGSCTLSSDAVTLDVKATGSNSVIDTISFTGSGIASIPYTIAETTALSLENVSIASTNPTVCFDGSTTNCNLVFADTGFIFGNDSDSIPVIPTQISGKPSNTGFNSEELFLQAVKTDDNTGSCVGVFPDGADVPVNLSYTCHGDSSACSSNLVLTNNSTAINLTTSAVEQSLRFSGESKAYFSLKYPDAGKLIVNVQKDIDVDGLGNIKSFSVSSNDFVVRPFGFKLSFVNDINVGNAFAQDAFLNPDASGSVFKKTGESFTLTATAMQWINGQDEDGVPDGVPDDFTFLNSSTFVAGNFSDEILIVTADLLAPSGGNNPALEQVLPINSFANSVFDNDYKYHEVGIIKLNANLDGGNYLGAGDIQIGAGQIQGQIANVGRFIPDNFAVTNPFVGNSCGNVTYMDEPAIELTYEIEARNSAEDVTQNYTGDFVKSSVALVAENSIDGIDLAPTRLIGYAGSWANGRYTNEEDKVPDIDLVTFTRDPTPVVDGPYDNLLFGVKLTGTEGAALNDLDMLTNTAKTLDAVESNIRFGRWTIENTFGPETSDLPVPMAIQYWGGSNFVTNTLDTCTTFDATNLTIDNTNINPGTTTASGSGNFVNGVTQGIILSAPGAPHQGAVPVTYVIPFMPWFLYDWSWNGTDPLDFTENPSAIATFGLFRGNDRIIYQREVH